MANTLTAIMPKILARGLLVLRKRCIMPRLVNSDLSSEAARFGSTIDVPIPTDVPSKAVAPAAVPPTPQSLTHRTVQVSLNNWQSAEFFLTDAERKQIDRSDSWLPMNVESAVASLANDINASVMTEMYQNAYYSVGTAGTAPFASDFAEVRNARKLLNLAMAPRAGRNAVLDATAEAAALGLAAFRDASQSGKDAVVVEGELGRFVGFDFYYDDQITTHSAGALGAGALTVNGVQAAGVGISSDGLSGTLSLAKAAGVSWSAKKGDTITFSVGGVVQYHVILADATVTHTANTTVTIGPPLRVATAGGETVTVTTQAAAAATVSSQNLLFHPNACALAMRPLSDGIDNDLGNKIEFMTDPVSGLSMRLEVSRQHKQTQWEFDVSWGVKCVRPAHIVRLYGS